MWKNNFRRWDKVLETRSLGTLFIEPRWTNSSSFHFSSGKVLHLCISVIFFLWYLFAKLYFYQSNSDLTTLRKSLTHLTCHWPSSLNIVQPKKTPSPVLGIKLKQEKSMWLFLKIPLWKAISIDSFRRDLVINMAVDSFIRDCLKYGLVFLWNNLNLTQYYLTKPQFFFFIYPKLISFGRLKSVKLDPVGYVVGEIVNCFSGLKVKFWPRKLV